MPEISADLMKNPNLSVEMFAKMIQYIQKQHPKIEDDVPPDWFVSTRMIDQHDQTIIAALADVDEDNARESTSPYHWARRIPTNVRAYTLTHDYSKVTGRQGITRISFEDNVEDQIGSNDGTWTGTEQYQTSLYGKSGLFNNASRVDLANESQFDRTQAQPFSVRIKFKADVNSSSSDAIWIKDSRIDSAYAGYWAYLHGTLHQVVFGIVNDTDNVYQVVSPLTYRDGKWHDLVCTFDGSSDRSGMKMYIDGILVVTGTSTTITGSILNNDVMKLGGSSIGNYWEGNLDDFEFWQVELTQGEITDMHNGQRGLKFPTEMDEELLAGAGCKTDGFAYMIIQDHAWFDVNNLVIACWLKLPATESGDGLRRIIVKENTFNISIQNHAGGANRITGQVYVGAATKSATFTYTPNTWFSFIMHANSTNITVWENNVQKGQTSTGGAIDTNANDVAIFASTSGQSQAKADTMAAFLTIGDKDIITDSNWRKRFNGEVVSAGVEEGLILDWEDATAEEITTFPFIQDYKAEPNSHSGFFWG